MSYDHTFAPMKGDPLIRFAGGYETDVYRTADRRFVVKIKLGRIFPRHEALREARLMRAIAERFTACLGAKHTIPSQYVVAGSGDAAHVLVVQPFLEHATPLHALRDDQLTPAEEEALADELREIVRRAWTCYRATGMLPDLYGLGGATDDERRRYRTWYLAPLYMWTFFVTRTLLRSHNLLLTEAPPGRPGGAEEPTAPPGRPEAPARRVVLVDYDIALGDRHRLVRRLYSAVRVLLFVRDLLLLRRRGRSSSLRRARKAAPRFGRAGREIGPVAAAPTSKEKFPARPRKPFSAAARLP